MFPFEEKFKIQEKYALWIHAWKSNELWKIRIIHDTIKGKKKNYTVYRAQETLLLRRIKYASEVNYYIPSGSSGLIFPKYYAVYIVTGLETGCNLLYSLTN